MLSKKDKVLIAASGGKDSTTVLYLLKKLGYNVCALTIDAGIGKYGATNLKRVREFCSENKIKLYETSLKKEFGYTLIEIQRILRLKKIAFQSCMICGVLRRNLLNKLARRIKATKVVTGHNLDDEAQTILMNLFRNSLKLGARLGPITGLIRDKKFIPRVKPLYFVSEKEVSKFSKKMKFDVIYTRCPYAADSLRDTVRNLLTEYEKRRPGTKQRIVENFISELPLFKKYFKTDKKLRHCKLCGEPSLYDVCNSCKLIGMLK